MLRSYLQVLGVLTPLILLAQTPPPKPAAKGAAVKRAVIRKAGSPTATAPKAGAPKAVPAVKKGPLYATIETSMGSMRLELFEKQTPVTVKNFADLATGGKVWTDPRIALPVRKPLYDGLTFHRVIPGFMIQGGDPLGNGSGRTKPIPDEIDPSLRFDQPGRLAMANAGPGTGSCQFFITEGPAPHLQGLHTIFGQLVDGQDVVKAIANAPRVGERPVPPITIQKITIARAP